MELHQDDIYATGPDDALAAFAKEICEHITLKVSPFLRAGSKYQHLKAGRLREAEDLYLTGNVKYADEIIKILGLQGAKAATTPIATKLLPEDLYDMCDDAEIKLFGHCVGIARFMINYVTEAVFAVHVLSKRLSGPTKNDMLRLKRLGGCLLGVRDFGLFMPMAGAIDILD